MSISALGYIGLNSERLDEWADFGPRVLGFQLAERSDDHLAFRLDERCQRVVVRRAPADTGFTGWEAADEAALGGMRAHLEAAGLACAVLDAPALALRSIAAGFHFRDPGGNRIEVFHGAREAGTPFVPGRPIAGFRTGALGAGHVVYLSPEVPALRRFYEDIMHFGLSDYFDSPAPTSFYHVGSRHHSLAFAGAPAPAIHHLMFEYRFLDDVGQGYDLARNTPGLLATTLGRHINDLMTSYYVASPDHFMIECGWGGLSLDPASWTPSEIECGPSLWGHDRSRWTVEQNAEAARLRDLAASRGMRMPVQVDKGNYHQGNTARPWWS